MSVEEARPAEVIIEPIEEWESDGPCPCCEVEVWLRLVARYSRGCCWVIFCSGCGTLVQKRWTLLP